MSATTQQPDSFETLVGYLLDRTITPAQRLTLIEQLRDEPAARDIYVGLIQLNVMLQWQHLNANIVLPDDSEADHHPRRRVASRPMLWRGAAMIIIGVSIAAIAWQLWPVKPVATLASATGAVWASDRAVLRSGSRLVPGVIELTAGEAAVTFDSGATVILTGPCRFELLTAAEGRLAFGHANTHVPKPAHGFAITTPAARCVDLGTRFDLTVSKQGDTRVIVREGRVRVSTIVAGLPPQQFVMVAEEVAEFSMGALRRWNLSEPVAEPIDQRLAAAGFEDENWHQHWVTNHRGGIRRVTDHAHRGQAALAFEAGHGLAMIEQVADVSRLAGSMIVFDAYARHDDDNPLVAGSGQLLQIRLRYFDAANRQIGMPHDVRLLVPGDKTGVYHWTRDVLSVPPHAVNLHYAIFLRDAGLTAGRAYVDDASVTPAEQFSPFDRSKR